MVIYVKNIEVKAILYSFAFDCYMLCTSRLWPLLEALVTIYLVTMDL